MDLRLCITNSNIGWHVIKTKDTGKVLSIVEHGDSGANITQCTQYNTDDQLWTWIDNSLISKHRGYALGFSAYNKKPGTNIIAWQYHGRQNQQWKFENGKLRLLASPHKCASFEGYDDWKIQFVSRRPQSKL